VSPRDVLERITIPDVTAEDMLRRGEEALSSAIIGTDEEPGKKPRADDDGDYIGGRDANFPRFSMGIGNFVELYGDESERGQWDGVATCFFLDTAPVVMEYVDTIHSALRRGGVWTNIGPLLYHWVEDTEHNNDERFQKSVEVSIV